MNAPIFFDTETCGFHGPIVILQFACGDGPIQIYQPWLSPIKETIALFELIATNPGGIVGFNIAFDWFHIYQMWTVLKILESHGWGDDDLIDRLDEYAEFEPQGRDGDCLKPVTACDLMLHARKGPYQSTMNRGDIRIRRVPTPLAWPLALKLDKLIPLRDIYFAKSKKKKEETRWSIQQVTNSDGEDVPEFKDVLLKFVPSTALKALAVDALGVKEDAMLRFVDVEVDPKLRPVEFGYAPFAKAVGNRTDWKGAWPEKIRHHIAHWSSNAAARKYASDDVDYTRRLYQFFGEPPLGDDDSVLACCVACVRWRGYKIDIVKLKELAWATTGKFYTVHNDQRFEIPTAPAQARAYVEQMMSPTEQLASKIKESTKRVLLESIAKWSKQCNCIKANAAPIQVTPNMSYQEMVDAAQKIPESKPNPNCEICKGTGKTVHPAAMRAKQVLDARQAGKELEVYEKLILAGRFHASFKVIGTLSSRMSGTDDLNAQGIKNEVRVREPFTFAFGGLILDGGDFSGFEVTLAEAVYNDPALRNDLLTCEKCEGHMEWDGDDFTCQECSSHTGKSIHALFGMNVYTDMDYKQLKASKGSADDKFTNSKKAVFAMFYGGVDYTLMDRLGVDLETAQEAVRRFHHKYPGVRKAQEGIKNDFESMKQPGGIGTQVVWHDPAEYIESMFGFKRYFTLENQICKVLYDLAQTPPKEWRDIKIKVLRRERMQTASGAVQSALYGAAFQLQAGNTRAAANHVIQSSGAQITKSVQRKIWEVQPPGVFIWLVQPCNIHDEILCPTDPTVGDRVAKIVKDSVENFRPKVPLIKMEWKRGLQSWAEK